MRQALEQLLSNTSLMLDSVRSGDWEQVSSYSQTRNELLQKLNLDALNSGQLQLLAPELERFRDMNRELMNEVRACQKQLGEELGRLRHSRSASRTYQQVSQG